MSMMAAGIMKASNGVVNVVMRVYGGDDTGDEVLRMVMIRIW